MLLLRKIYDFREISELHKARVTHVSEAHKAALDVEIAAKEQLTAALDECRQQMKREQMALVNQVGLNIIRDNSQK